MSPPIGGVPQMLNKNHITRENTQTYIEIDRKHFILSKKKFPMPTISFVIHFLSLKNGAPNQNN